MKLPVSKTHCIKSEQGSVLEPNKDKFISPPKQLPVSQSAERLVEVMDELEQGALVLNAEGSVLYANEKASVILKRSLHKLPSMPLQEIFKEIKGKIPTRFQAPTVVPIPYFLDGNQVLLIIPAKKKTINLGAVAIFIDNWTMNALSGRVAGRKGVNDQFRPDFQHDWTAKYDFSDIVGVSDLLAEAKKRALQVAATDSTVLLTGESGTGKELFAHAIHANSKRRCCPFVRINCSSIPSELLEAEMFGHEAGAFTGALKKGRPGMFEIADKGTIFLDEITQLNWDIQAKLLRVLQEKEIVRVGGAKPIMVDFRLILATNENIEIMMQSGRFRSDLYYRINVFPINIPPLRERKDDIRVLINHFAERLQKDEAMKSKQLSESVFKIFENYDWPGNVREMINVLEQIFISSRADLIGPLDLPPYLSEIEKREDECTDMDIDGSLKELIERAEKMILIKAIEQVGGNKTEAANLLGIHRSGLYQKIKKYDLS